MSILKSNDILDMCNHNHTLASEYLRISRGTARRRLSEGKIIVVDGEVYIKQGKINESVLGCSRIQRFDQYLDLTQSVLSETRSIGETADLLCEKPRGRKRYEEKNRWVKRITRWIGEGKLVL